jgi:hypothetical protein
MSDGSNPQVGYEQRKKGRPPKSMQERLKKTSFKQNAEDFDTFLKQIVPVREQCFLSLRGGQVYKHMDDENNQDAKFHLRKRGKVCKQIPICFEDLRIKVKTFASAVSFRHKLSHAPIFYLLFEGVFLSHKTCKETDFNSMIDCSFLIFHD